MTTSIAIFITVAIVVSLLADYMGRQQTYYKIKYEAAEKEILTLQLIMSKLPQLKFHGDPATDLFDKDGDDEEDD